MSNGTCILVTINASTSSDSWCKDFKEDSLCTWSVEIGIGLVGVILSACGLAFCCRRRKPSKQRKEEDLLTMRQNLLFALQTFRDLRGVGEEANPTVLRLEEEGKKFDEGSLASTTNESEI
jgi:hypothetical protein